jgi:hypothetical protein
MKRTRVFLIVLMSLVIASVVLGQSERGTSFAPVQQLGQIHPQGMRYDTNFDRFAWVDPRGQLMLVDAATFETQHILYESGSYNAYRFSHDGRYLALAIDLRVELWDTQTGTEVLSIAPDGALSVTGPLLWSDDDSFLLFSAVVRAPAAIRRSENDTSILPWLWDLPAARDEGDSRLPGRVEAYSFFDYRNGFVLGPNELLIAALPERLLLFDVVNRDIPQIGEILTARFERDPLDTWFSLRDDMIYVRPVNQSNLIQVNSETGAFFDIPVGRYLGHREIREMAGLLISDQARIIGQANSRESSSILRLLLGQNYLADWAYHPLTVTLLDVLEPVTVTSDQMGLLVYIFDEQDGHGVIEFLRPQDIVQMTMYPDDTRLMVRRASGTQPIEVYNLETGVQELSIVPAIPDFDGRHVLAYNATGDVIISDFQRFDAATGAVLREDLSYNAGYDQFFFTEDSQKLVTLTGSEWWLWDIASRQVIRRERVNLRGSLAQTSPDGHRFLSYVDTPFGRGVEVVEVGQEERNSVTFESLPGRDIFDIVPSPDWENYLVVYSPNPHGPHYPGYEVALYNLHQGKRWFVAGDDLPHPENTFYGWLDNETAYVSGENFGGQGAPMRIYGLDYDASGLPMCLVEAFPGEWTQWVGLWEQFNARLHPDSLGRLTQTLCDALPATTDEVNAIFNPSPTPTLPPVTSTPSVIVGVPVCLTSLFPGEALDYAEEWRRLTVGLSPEEIADLEEMLCEGLNGPNELAYDSYGYGEFNSSVEVMTIDMETGVRAFGPFLPTQPRVTSSLDLVMAEFQRTEGFYPEGAVLSSDARLLAMRNSSGHIQIYRLLTPYETLAANATATVAIQETGPALISVLPTATRAFEIEGQPRPTLTPTMTPISPPTPAQAVAQTSLGQVEEICPLEVTLHTLDAPPPDYMPPGVLFVALRGSDDIWVLDPATGRLVLDDTLPPCELGINCNFSFDRNWILVYGTNIVVSRPDGSEARVLFESREQAVWPADVHWVGTTNILEYFYQGYLPDQFADPVTLVQRIDLDSGIVSEPFLPPPGFASIQVNELPTELVSPQTNDGTLAVVRTSFPTGSVIGYKYYIADRDTEAVDYFARLNDLSFGDMTFEWHPSGSALYYHYPGAGDWFIYDPATREHHVLGNLPGGVWSREGRYRGDFFTLPDEEFQERKDAGLPIPNFTIWDSDTGLIRRYCLPLETWQLTYAPWQWSPDSRYIAFPAGPLNQDEVAIDHFTLLVMDTQTGYVTDLAADTPHIIAWTQERAQ